MDLNKYLKITELFETLSKDDLSLQEALKIARKHNEKAGKVLAKHLYTSLMVPRAGNKFAYNDFLTRHGNSGIHLSIDLNSHGAVNKQYGYEAGDAGIKNTFNKMAEASRKFGGKFFHISGDEARAHFSSPERAMAFINEVKQTLPKNPKLHGQFQPSASVGVGYTPEHAEKALIGAKDQLGPLVGGKRQKIHPLGEEPTVHHSLLHEPPPANWKPEKDHPNMGKSTPINTPGLALKNPL